MRAVLLDRDGVINQDSDDYIKSAEEWVPIPGSLDAIARLKRAGFFIGVATNQSGLARGLFDHPTLTAMHEKMKALLAHAGGQVDAIEYCPHHPKDACDCRKPKPYMLLALCTLFQISPDQAYFIGDTEKDMQCAHAAGCQGILVKTGKGERALQANPSLKDRVPIYASLQSFVDALGIAP